MPCGSAIYRGQIVSSSTTWLILAEDLLRCPYGVPLLRRGLALYPVWFSHVWAEFDDGTQRRLRWHANVCGLPVVASKQASKDLSSDTWL